MGNSGHRRLKEDIADLREEVVEIRQRIDELVRERGPPPAQQQELQPPQRCDESPTPVLRRRNRWSHALYIPQVVDSDDDA